MSALDELIKFWQSYTLEDVPFVHPEDSDCVKLDEYLRREGETDHDYLTSDGLKLEIPPTPILGDLRNAKVVICMLNPAVGLSDLKSLEDKAFKEALFRNLKQDFQTNEDYPFISLNPEYCWTGGFAWWYSKFKPIIEVEQKYCSERLKAVAKQVAAVELLAYPSKSFSSNKLIRGKNKQAPIKSTELMKNWVKEEKNKLLIVCRRTKDWGLEKKCDKPDEWVFPNSSTVAPSNLKVLPSEFHRGANFAKHFKNDIESKLIFDV